MTLRTSLEWEVEKLPKNNHYIEKTGRKTLCIARHRKDNLVTGYKKKKNSKKPPKINQITPEILHKLNLKKYLPTKTVQASTSRIFKGLLLMHVPVAWQWFYVSILLVSTIYWANCKPWPVYMELNPIKIEF